MKVDIPTKPTIKRMVDDAIRKEMGKVFDLLTKFRNQLIELEEKLKVYDRTERRYKK